MIIGGIPMENLAQSVSKIFKNAIKAFERYPITIVNALAFSIVTIVRIHLDWPAQEPYNFLFNCLHLSFALGAILGLTTITISKNMYNNKKSFIVANLFVLSATIITFLSLYFFNGIYPELSANRYKVVSTIAAARVSAIIFISFLLFIIAAGYPKEQSDFSKSLFMTHKSFFIASIYGSIMAAGASGVAGAIRTLLYKEMSSNVYGYIGTLSGFLAFTIFVGYFPKFGKDVVDEQREIAQRQPRFIEVLFEYILTPVMLALTLVLILWAGKTIISGMKVSFVMLYSIASSYAIGGIWLYMMVTHLETGLVKAYKNIYPIVALLILFFEAWALVIQIQKYGVKTTEYLFILLWLIALVSAILLIFKKEESYHYIVGIVCALTLLSVTPYIGYNVLPVKLQINRLQDILVEEGMFKDGKIVPATKMPEKNTRELITDAVIYLAYTEDEKLPDWFDKNLREVENFEKSLGFEQIFPQDEDFIVDDNYSNLSLFLRPGVIDISSYDWALNMEDYSGEEGKAVKIDGDRGEYKIYWRVNSPNGIPSLKVLLNGETIIEENLNKYLD